MKRLPVLLLLALAAVAQLPTVTSSIFPVSFRDGRWTARNAGRKAITAYLYHVGHKPLQLDSRFVNVAVELRACPPIEPGDTVEIPVKADRTLDGLEILAVVFDDGAVLGSARTVAGDDLVASIFDFRKAEAQEMRGLLSVLDNSDRNSAFTNLLHSLETVPPGTDMASSGRASGASQVRALLEGTTGRSDEDRYQALRSSLAERIAAVERVVIRRTL